MKKLLISILALSFTLYASMVSAQVNPEKPLMTIGDEAVSKAEFLNTFSKNNDLKKTTAQELRDYLDLYVNFKLKVKEGRRSKLTPPPLSKPNCRLISTSRPSNI